MPRIFDNIELGLLPALKKSLETARRADFCVGYFNLRGWKVIADSLDHWQGGADSCCRLLVGMPVDQERSLGRNYSLEPDSQLLDQSTAKRLQMEMARKFREQLMLGAPSTTDERGLRKLLSQLKAGKLIVKLHLKYALHAKLYLLFRDDHDNPRTGYVGSSNLTLAGLQNQGELNVDVLEHDATAKLEAWFNERWNDNRTIDITEDLIKIIEESWITTRTPFEIYVKMAYHLSREARVGVETFEIPKAFRSILFEYQAEAVKIAANHLDKRNGVLFGDVVGLGKTMMGSALIKSYADRHNVYPLIICPPNLIPMWRKYDVQYDLRSVILSSGKLNLLEGEFTRHRLVIIDESHNLRNRESKGYRFVRNYIEQMQAAVILLSATPYNKEFADISSQLRLFVGEDLNLGIRPEQLLGTFPNGEIDFVAQHQCPVNTIAAFEKSPHKEDWQQLMQRYMVRRTRTFIKRVYATPDELNQRRYLVMADGTRNYFPDRLPHTVKFQFNENDPTDPYARLFRQQNVDLINSLHLPRYNLYNLLTEDAKSATAGPYASVVKDLSRAGARLIAFCRVNLYKRLESCGESFLQSVERHIVRNYLFLHALENNLPIPIGPQQGWVLDTAINDAEDQLVQSEFEEEDEVPDRTSGIEEFERAVGNGREPAYRDAARRAYETLDRHFKNQFHWLPADLFIDETKAQLEDDARKLSTILDQVPYWDPEQDCKLRALRDLLVHSHSQEKVLIFTEFADTARYLEQNLKGKVPGHLECAIGGQGNVTDVAARFSPISNNAPVLNPLDETRVLIATDVMSEGQNLQDCNIVVNFDLPWAIIRLVQRAGRVDRIGQKSPTIDCYSFVPMQGVEDIIKLRRKIRTRLAENAEVVGTDEEFFDDEAGQNPYVELYNERSGILDGDEDESEVDLQSRAYAIYNEAIQNDPSLESKVKNMPDVVFSAKAKEDSEGVVVFVRTPDDTDSLALVDASGRTVTENQSKILDTVSCEPETPTLKESDDHHDLVMKGVKKLLENREATPMGALGKRNGARYRAYMALKDHLTANAGSLLIPPEMHRALEFMLRSPLKESATHILNERFRLGAAVEEIAELVHTLFLENRLCHDEETEGKLEPRIICSMGLV